MIDYKEAICLLKNRAMSHSFAKELLTAHMNGGHVKSKVHPYGFSVLNLHTEQNGSQLRLHIYPETFHGDTRVHKHDWHLHSFVILGCIENTIWDISESQDAKLFQYDVATRNNISESTLREKRVSKSFKCKDIITTGKHYHMLSKDYHTVSTKGFTATLLYQEKVENEAVTTIDEFPFSSDTVSMKKVEVPICELKKSIKRILR